MISTDSVLSRMDSRTSGRFSGGKSKLNNAEGL